MDTSSFTIPIEVPANNVATIALTYQEVLRRQEGVYDIRVIVGHCGNRYNTHVRLSITETKPLTKLKVVPYWERPMQGNYLVPMMQLVFKHYPLILITQKKNYISLPCACYPNYTSKLRYLNH